MSDNKPKYLTIQAFKDLEWTGYEFYSKKFSWEKQLWGKYGDSKTALTCWVSQVQAG